MNRLKRSVAHRTVHWVTIKGFYPYYTHTSRSAAISRSMLSTISVLVSRGSDINCRNSAIVLNELFPYWRVNRLLSRLTLILFICTHKKYSGGLARNYVTFTFLHRYGTRIIFYFVITWKNYMYYINCCISQRSKNVINYKQQCMRQYIYICQLPALYALASTFVSCL